MNKYRENPAGKRMETLKEYIKSQELKKEAAEATLQNLKTKKDGSNYANITLALPAWASVKSDSWSGKKDISISVTTYNRLKNSQVYNNSDLYKYDYALYINLYDIDINTLKNKLNETIAQFSKNIEAYKNELKATKNAYNKIALYMNKIADVAKIAGIASYTVKNDFSLCDYYDDTNNTNNNLQELEHNRKIIEKILSCCNTLGYREIEILKNADAKILKTSYIDNDELMIIYEIYKTGIDPDSEYSQNDACKIAYNFKNYTVIG